MAFHRVGYKCLKQNQNCQKFKLSSGILIFGLTIFDNYDLIWKLCFNEQKLWTCYMYKENSYLWKVFYFSKPCVLITFVLQNLTYIIVKYDFILKSYSHNQNTFYRSSHIWHFDQSYNFTQSSYKLRTFWISKPYLQKKSYLLFFKVRIFLTLIASPTCFQHLNTFYRSSQNWHFDQSYNFPKSFYKPRLFWIS